MQSRYENEPKPLPYILPFAPELVSLILRGEKVKTYRFGLKYDYLNIGDKIKLQNWDTKEILCDAVITGKSKAIFKDLPLNHPGHENYSNKEEQREIFSNYYAYLKRKIADEDVFLIIEFQLT